MKSPIDKGRGDKDDKDVCKDDAPIRKDALAKIVSYYSGEPIMFFVDFHYLPDFSYILKKRGPVASIPHFILSEDCVFSHLTF